MRRSGLINSISCGCGFRETAKFPFESSCRHRLSSRSAARCSSREKNYPARARSRGASVSTPIQSARRFATWPVAAGWRFKRVAAFSCGPSKRRRPSKVISSSTAWCASSLSVRARKASRSSRFGPRSRTGSSRILRITIYSSRPTWSYGGFCNTRYRPKPASVSKPSDSTIAGTPPRWWAPPSSLYGKGAAIPLPMAPVSFRAGRAVEVTSAASGGSPSRRRFAVAELHQLGADDPARRRFGSGRPQLSRRSSKGVGESF